MRSLLPVLAAVALIGALLPAGAQATGRHLIWSDEFNGPAGTAPDPGHWDFDTGGGGWGNGELEYYTSSTSNAALDGHGDLTLIARAGAYTGADGVTRNYTSARLQTLHTFQFTYGRLEARIRVPKGKGLLPTFWALGNEAYDGPGSWPACGEVDAMEVRGANPSVVYGTLHGPWPWAPGGLGSTLRTGPLAGRFHTYGVDWSPSKLSFLLDGKTYGTVRHSDLRMGSAWPFDHPFFVLMNLAVGGHFAGRPGSSSHFPATMKVDWVRVWQ